ncbi:MAG: SAM-dependent methyltransferase [Coleofasciculaceae cyanobacterium]
MFDLKTDELKLKILDCAGGPASFNAEMTCLGYEVVSCDPIYQFRAKEIAQRIQDTYQTVVNGVRDNKDNYVWKNVKSPEEMGQIRMSAMHKFLQDLPKGTEEKRYITGELPILALPNENFDLALCSHFLFTYSDLLSLEFHIKSIIELCRVASNVRVFPLLNVSGEKSILLPSVINELKRQGCRLEIRKVPYEFQKGGNQMLQVWKE